MTYKNNLLKSFTDRAYRHTAMVTHKGVVIAFAMDHLRRIYYTVLNFDKTAGSNGRAEGLGELDVKYWEEPQPVPFPKEISQVGFSIADPTEMPLVKKDSGGLEADPASLRREEIDPLYSTTARLSAEAPFQVLSDGKFIYLFRQSIAAGDNAALFKTIDGGASAKDQQPEDNYVTDVQGVKVPVVSDTLLVDRFTLAGRSLLPKMEVRYRRSRNKHIPQSAKDSLGAQDMNEQPFYEPTHELDFVHNLHQGRFSVLLLPTQVAEVKQWQIFAHNGSSGQIDTFNVERSKDGLFNTRGTTFYTCPDPQYQASVFERKAGTYPFTGEALIPLVEASGYAETALALDGGITRVEVRGYKGITGPNARTAEAWIKTTATDVAITAWGSNVAGQMWTLALASGSGALRLDVNRGYIVGTTPVNDGQWHHVSGMFDPVDGGDVINARLYVDGVLEQNSDSQACAVDTAGETDLRIGTDFDDRFFAGQIDEVRLWDRARTETELRADMNFRLVGNEPGLVGYWRFDEGRGAIAYDQSGNGRYGTIYTAPVEPESTPEDVPAPSEPTSEPITTALALDGQGDYIQMAGYKGILGTNARTFEAWFKISSAHGSGRIVEWGTRDHSTLWSLAVQSWTGTPGSLIVTVYAGHIAGSTPVNDDQWHHVACTFDPADGNDVTDVRLYVDGVLEQISDSQSKTIDTVSGGDLLLGNDQVDSYFNGQISEVRLWDRARTEIEIQADMNRRLTGSEAGLVGYWPLDEGSGTTATDRSGNGHDGTLQGDPTWIADAPPLASPIEETVSLPPAPSEPTSEPLNQPEPDWVASDAPIGERPGFHRASFSFLGRGVASGLTALLYHQQEQALAGYDQQAKPLKKNARVMLAVSTRDVSDGATPNYIAALDFAVSRQGRLAQTPDLVDLGVPLTSSVNEDLVRLQELEQKLKSGTSDASIQNEVEEIRSRLSEEVVLPMPLLQTDAFGLTTSGALLGFAHTGDTPYLFDSATGKLALYFRGNTGQFFAAYFDTNTKRAQYRLAADGGDLVFVARSAEPEADQSTVTVADGPDEAYCTIVIENPVAGITETWNRVPRQGRALASVLNGQAGLPVFVGTLVAAVSGTVTDLALSNNVRRPLEAGDTLLVGDTKAQVAVSVLRGDAAVTIEGAALEAGAGTAVYLLPYDYAARATSNRVTDKLERGSLFLSVVPDGTRVSAINGTATSSTATPSCHWRAESPGNALFFQGSDGYLSRDGEAAALNKLEAGGDMTLEAWVKPGAVQDTARVIHHSNEGAQYTLGLQNASLGHSALAFDGSSDYVDTKISLLNNLTDFTLEGWIKPGKADDNWLFGQPYLHGLQLHQGKFILRGFNYLWEADSLAYRYPLNEWHHVAAVGTSYLRQLYFFAEYFLNLKLYVDGVLLSNIDDFIKFSRTNSNPVCIGSLLGRDGFFAGQMDEIRMWNYARSQSDIREAMHRRLQGGESGLVGYWTFEQAEQGKVIDRSGNGHHGYIQGSPSTAPTPLKGNVFFAGVGSQFRQSSAPILADTWQHLAAVHHQSYALAFDGKDDHLTAEHTPSLNINRDLTLELFFQIDDLSTSQGLVSKGRLQDGTAEVAPYALYIADDGRLMFAYEDKDGTLHEFHADQPLAAGTFYRVAVTRKHETVVENLGSESVPDIKVNHVATVNFYLNREEAGSDQRLAPFSGVNQQSFEIGKVVDNEYVHRLRGIISEVRLWNTCLARQNVGRSLSGDEDNLVAWWRFEENDGVRAHDVKGGHHAAIQGAKWVKNPDPDGSRLTLYHNGTPVASSKMVSPPAWYNNTKQFTLGATRSGSQVIFPFQGTMEEIRIWQSARSHEQILDNLFTRLKGEKQDLIANYTFDEGAEATVFDQGLRGNHLTLGNGTNAPAWTLSTAPIGTDIAPVRSALAGIKTAFHDTIGSPPSVQEYADLQTDDAGNLIGVMKRCYGYIKEGAWHLMTGYKVGNLNTEWVGQVQANPQIVGFIEGAPPVPSENMTSTSAKLGEYEDYNGSALIELEEPETVNYVFASSAESGTDMAFDLATETGLQSNTNVGFGLISEVEDTRLKIGTHTTFEASTSNVSEAEASFGRNITKTTRMELHGYWEEPEDQGGQYINPAVGRRYLPENNGLALVQPDTMDVFALRLAHNNALVAYRMRPNPDIPKDWNFLVFPINPRYVKQGTLDGRVGAKEDGSIQTDPDYPRATQYGQYSYFKPTEAYSLKKRIEREQQEMATYYQQYNTAQSIGNHDNDAEVPGRVAARNLANTYVWTAEGGFFAETSEVMEATSESTTGSYSFTGMSGLHLEFNLAIMKTATMFEMDALFGRHLETSKSRSLETEESFTLAVEVAPDSDLQLHVNTPEEEVKYAGHIDQESLAAWHPDGRPVLRPGRVDAYRFMTFYLEPAQENFEDFFNKVIDPIWLAQSEDPDAMALRQAQQAEKKPKCWRIMHQVTFVSRILPEVAPGTKPATVEEAMQVVDVQSNWALIKKLEPFVRTQTESYAVFADAVEQAVSTYLPELLPHAEEVTAYAALYFGVNTEGDNGID